MFINILALSFGQFGAYASSLFEVKENSKFNQVKDNGEDNHVSALLIKLLCVVMLCNAI